MANEMAGTGATIVSDNTDFPPALNLISIEGPEASRDTIDLSHDTVADSAKHFAAQRNVDGGEVEVTVVMDSAQQTKIYGILYAGSKDTYTINFPLPEGSSAGDTNLSFEFNGIITNIGVSIPTDDKIEQTFTLKVSGKITVTDYASD